MRRPARGKGAGRATLAVSLLALVAGCTSYERFRFVPSPITFEVDDGRGLTGEVRVASTGIEKVGEDEEGNNLLTIGFELRVENRGDEPMYLLANELLLLDARLVEFGAPAVVPAEGTELSVAPGEHALFAITFPFPPDPDEMDIETVDLRGTVASAGGQALFQAGFELQIASTPYHYGGPVYTGNDYSPPPPPPPRTFTHTSAGRVNR